MTTTDTAPDLTGAVAYDAVGALARGTGRWYVTPDRRVHYQRPNGAWTPPSIVTADDLEGSPTWQRVDATPPA